MCVTRVVVVCSLVVSVVLADNDPYTVPSPRIEVFRPRGFRVSIPDSPGINSMTFRAVVNLNSNVIHSPDISKDIFHPTDGRWVFEDNRTKLNRGDVLRFWLFVARYNLGFNLDDERYVVNRFEDAPAGFLTNDPKKKPKPDQSVQSVAQHAPVQTERPSSPPSTSSDCPCTRQPQPELTTTIPPPPTCQEPVTTSELPTVTTTTTTVKPTVAPAELQVWKDILVSLSTENAEFRDKVQVLMDLNALMISKFERMGDENLKKLILGGIISQEDAPFPLVNTVLKEKLGIMHRILTSAVRNTDGTITFELATFNDKLNVLLEAKEKLKNSKITIKDIDHVSFMNPDGVHVLDMRTGVDENLMV